jgi:hypothetical protein
MYIVWLLFTTGKAVLQAAIEKEPALRGRNWRNLKDFIRNQIQTLKKNT